MTEITKIIEAVLSWFRRRPAFLLVIAVAISSLIVRALLASEFGTSAILYVAVPFMVTAALVLIDPRDASHWTIAYYRAFRATFAVLFGVSIVLYEGIVCVLMFLPIYLIIALLALAADGIGRFMRRRSGSSMRAYVLPVVVLLSSLEGTHEDLSFDRRNTVSVSRTASVPVNVLRENIGKPFELSEDRHWFLKIFPMPHRVVPPSMKPGAIHEANYTYHRWFFTNTHQGQMALQIADVSNTHVSTKILKDTSYISHYLRLEGTRIHLSPIDADTTEVTLTVHFERRLDPAWYFGPLQRYGVTLMADFLIEEVIVR